MQELRILNGLHRGATLPLDQSTLIIGASEDADVVLVDHDIETRHATLSLTEQGWKLSALDGAVRDAETNHPQEVLDLQAGAFARIGHVWVTVVDADAPWSHPPAEPVDAPPEEEPEEESFAMQADEEENAELEEDASQDEEAALAQEAEPAEDELYSDSPLDGPLHADQPAAAPAPAPQAARPGLLAGWRRSRMLMVPLALATVLSACAAYTMTATSDDEPALKTSKADKLSADGPATATALAPAPVPVVDLRDAFRQRLREVDLLRRFELDLREKNWTMHAALDDEETARFERVLAQFIHTHNIKFPVHAKVGSAEGMLPFRIRQVISGSNASIITHDGNRLYIGDEYRGVRLVAIEGNQLRFDGERKIKVKW